MIQQAKIAGIILAVTILTAGVGWGVSIYTDRIRLQVENQELGQSLAALTTQARETERALDVEKARSQKFLERSRELTDVIEGIITGGTPDAPLHPDLAIILNGLRPSTAD